ncbi:hypothetical protein ACFTAO_18505 [Paenibacillus rhizoplanae]|uniref:Uncharacterized protein n=1 Tax=Paenibacillus rhizoplanae TaxID=1917181 RepID=A0ABW5F5L3_9BACL
MRRDWTRLTLPDLLKAVFLPVLLLIPLKYNSHFTGVRLYAE